MVKIKNFVFGKSSGKLGAVVFRFDLVILLT